MCQSVEETSSPSRRSRLTRFAHRANQELLTRLALCEEPVSVGEGRTSSGLNGSPSSTLSRCMTRRWAWSGPREVLDRGREHLRVGGRSSCCSALCRCAGRRGSAGRRGGAGRAEAASTATRPARVRSRKPSLPVVKTSWRWTARGELGEEGFGEVGGEGGPGGPRAGAKRRRRALPWSQRPTVLTAMALGLRSRRPSRSGLPGSEQSW